jgi:hypothetical protein
LEHYGAFVVPPVAHPKISLTNTWKDIINFPKGYDCHSDSLQIKFCTQGTAGDDLADFGLGFVDGIGRSVILHCALVLLHEQAAAFAHRSLEGRLSTANVGLVAVRDRSGNQQIGATNKPVGLLANLEQLPDSG